MIPAQVSADRADRCKTGVDIALRHRRRYHARVKSSLRMPTVEAEPQDAAWHLRLLGGFELSDGRQRLTRLGSRAATALLARLALRPAQAHAREELVELLWPGVDAEAGRHRLRQTLSTLRALLEPPAREAWGVFEVDRLSIRLRPGALSCDVLQFERALARQELALARALYRGELLPGVFDEWVHEERLRLSALAERALPPADVVTGAEPAAGPPNRPPPAASVTASRLPHYLTRLLGLDQQAARLQADVLQHRLVCVLGEGGIGKTRLAVEVAHALSDGGSQAAWASAALGLGPACAPFDLCAFVPLAACTTALAVLDEIQLTLRLPAGRAEPVAAVAEALAGRRVLLVLDNLEQVAEAAAPLVSALLQRLPGLHIVMTSRRLLGVPGEHAYTVVALDLPHAQPTLAQALLNPAVAMFVDRARAARSDFHLHAGNLQGVLDVVHLLDGLPLALELAAARVRTVAPAQMAQLLQASMARGHGTLALLARPAGAAGADRRHASMQAAIAWSWQLLSPAQADQLAALTVPHSPFSTAAVCALLGVDRLAAALLLDELTTQSMLRAEPGQHGDMRFNLPEPIRGFAAGTLAVSAQRALRERHRAGWMARARALPLDVSMAELRADWPDAMRALQSAEADACPDQALHLMLALRGVVEALRLPASALRVIEGALEVCTDDALAAEGHAVLAPLELVAGRATLGLRHVELALQRTPADRQEVQAEALINAARVRWTLRQNDPEIDSALARADALLDASTHPMATALRARALSIRGLVLSSRASLARRETEGQHAESLHRQAMDLWLAAGNVHMVAKVAFDLGLAAYYARRPADAVERMTSVMAHARANGLTGRLSQAAQVLGDAWSQQRRWLEAASTLRECVLVAWDNHAPLDFAFGLRCLPRPLLRLGHVVAALQLSAFAEAYWAEHIGEVDAAQRRELHGVRRLAAAAGLAPSASDRAVAEGRRLSPAAALELIKALIPA